MLPAKIIVEFDPDDGEIFSDGEVEEIMIYWARRALQGAACHYKTVANLLALEVIQTAVAEKVLPFERVEFRFSGDKQGYHMDHYGHSEGFPNDKSLMWKFLDRRVHAIIASRLKEQAEKPKIDP